MAIDEILPIEVPTPADEPFVAVPAEPYVDIETALWSQLKINETQLTALHHKRFVQRANGFMLLLLLLAVVFVGYLGSRFAFDYVAAQSRDLPAHVVDPYVYALAIVLCVLCVLVVLAYLIVLALARVRYRVTDINRLIGDQNRVIMEARDFLSLRGSSHAN